jgi:hypothetical protein
MEHQAKPEKIVKVRWDPESVRQIAQLVTTHKGSEALNRFAKMLVIGSAKDKGFSDSRNENMNEVFDREFVSLGYFNLLTRFSFANDANRFTWDFASGVTEGQKLSGFASAKGRHSKWVGDGAAKYWEEQNVSGVVLLGMEADLHFYYLSREQFLLLNQDRISARVGDSALVEWEQAWDQLKFQQTFDSILAPRG